MIACPKCKSVSNHRMKRKGIARYIRGSRTYACENCNKVYAWIPFINRTF